MTVNELFPIDKIDDLNTNFVYKFVLKRDKVFYWALKYTEEHGKWLVYKPNLGKKIGVGDFVFFYVKDDLLKPFLGYEIDKKQTIKVILDET